MPSVASQPISMARQTGCERRAQTIRPNWRRWGLHGMCFGKRLLFRSSTSRRWSGASPAGADARIGSDRTTCGKKSAWGLHELVCWSGGNRNFLRNQLAGEPGFEPGLTESESAGLPLTYSPASGRRRVAVALSAVRPAYRAGPQNSQPRIGIQPPRKMNAEDALGGGAVREGLSPLP